MILNMRSATNDAQERIRWAAVELFGDLGYDATSVRQIATSAKVSPGLVIHHFGSKEGLRAACDAYVLGFVSEERRDVLLGSTRLASMQHYLADHPELAPMVRYLRRSLGEGGETGRAIFGRLAEDNLKNLQLGEEHGKVRATPDPRARAALLTAWNTAMILVGDLAADFLEGDSILDVAVVERLERALLDVFTDGLLTDDTLRRELRQP